MKRRGLALIVVVGVLGVMSVLAVAFVIMAQLERKASLQRVNAAKAYLLAKSGIEDALARLEKGQDPNDPFNQYAGDDWDADGSLSTYEKHQQIYNPGKLNTDACPVRDAMHPSYPVWNSTRTTPLVVTLDGRDRGYSGTLSGDALATGNTYALKVTSENGFDVNGGDLFPDGSGIPTYNSNLRNMLGVLAEAVDRDDGNHNKVGQADGFALIDQRPAGGWTGFDQIRDLALGGSQTKLDMLRPYLAIHAWRDTRVIRPNAADAMVGKFYHSWGDILLDRPVGRTGSRAPDFERVRGQVVGRAPVSLSWARQHPPALIALISGLKGIYLDDFYESPYKNWVLTVYDNIGKTQSEEVENLWSNRDACHEVATAILNSTSELRTWQEWNDFVDGIPAADLTKKGGSAQHKREILKVNFNPNSDLNKFNPNSTMWRPMDKSDLLIYSTEFDLAGGVQAQEVESVGRVAGKDGRVLATRTLRAVLSWPKVVRLSTQREFVCENLGDLDLAGDEANFRRPGYQVGGNEAFISQSQGLGSGSSKETTWGQKLDTTASNPGTWMNGTSNGASLQVYPEPYVDTGAGLSINPADYDGSIQLATLETPKDDFYGAAGTDPVTATTVQDMKMLAHFDDRFELDEAANAAAWGKDCRPDAQQVARAELGNSLWDAAKPNTLHPDGAYSERDRVPAFYDQANSDGFHGVLSFWVKPNYGVGAAGGAGYERGHAYVMRTNDVDGGGPGHGSLNQFFFLGNPKYYPGGLTLHFEGDRSGFDPDVEQQFGAPGGSPPSRRWSLVTAWWDFRSDADTGTEACGRVMFNAGTGAAQTSGDGTYSSFSNANSWKTAQDITVDDLSGPGHTLGHHMLSLGPLSGRDFYTDVPNHIGGGADATFDEFAVYDFGGAVVSPDGTTRTPATSASLASPITLALNRYTIGRYYRESKYVQNAYATNTAGEWYSAPINLGGGVAQLKQLSWTQIIPRGLRAPLPAGGVAGVDGDRDDAAGANGDPGDARIVFELRDASSPANFAKDAGGSDIAALFTDDRGSGVNRPVSGPFRLHAIFQPNLYDRVSTPLLDTPVLDDITLIASSPGGPRLLSWEEVVNE